ncbi:hypothetical protein [Acidovorax sp. LjRoot117]|uniref:hypothetical protein n=1 Tax=Acidovorax sp. LjRoot117 TaxID=3342255 RepID=UPI003ECEA7C0
MTRDEILAMARAAGLQRTNPGEAVEVVRFAEMVAAKERAECAKLVQDTQEAEPYGGINGWQCADAIRARGQKGGA